MIYISGPDGEPLGPPHPFNVLPGTERLLSRREVP